MPQHGTNHSVRPSRLNHSFSTIHNKWLSLHVDNQILSSAVHLSALREPSHCLTHWKYSNRSRSQHRCRRHINRGIYTVGCILRRI